MEQENKSSVSAAFYKSHRKSFTAPQDRPEQPQATSAAAKPQEAPTAPQSRPEPPQATSTGEKPQEAPTAPRNRPQPLKEWAIIHCPACIACQELTRQDDTKGIYCLVCHDWVSDKAGKSLIKDCTKYEEADASPFSLA